MKFTLTNDFHGTSTTATLFGAVAGRLSDRQVKRVHDDLCGADDCCCSGVLGTRGPQECRVEEDSRGYTISSKTLHPNGSPLEAAVER